MLLLWADARDEVPARMASVVVVDVDVEADMMLIINCMISSSFQILLYGIGQKKDCVAGWTRGPTKH